MKLTWMVGMCVLIYFGGMHNVYGVEDQKTLTTFPPPEYDHPFSGKLEVHYLDDGALEIKAHCPANMYGQRLGCMTINRPGYCQIYIGPIDELETYGLTDITVLRHEIGHCNGWPGNHPNIRALKPGETRKNWNARQARWKAFVEAREKKYQEIFDCVDREPKGESIWGLFSAFDKCGVPKNNGRTEIIINGVIVEVKKYSGGLPGTDNRPRN
jgi:hypothetical protein